jgi:type IV pilus assembly protein PilW
MHTKKTLQRQRGFSLIELMIAALVGLILLAGLVRVVISTSSSHREVSESGRLLENGRYAMALLTEEIEHAGFLDQFDSAEVPEDSPNPCATDVAALENDLGMPVQGLDAQQATFAVPTCLSSMAAHRSGTDILIVRRASTTATDPAALTANEWYLQGRFDKYVLDQGQNAVNFNLTNPMSDPAAPVLLPIRKYRTDIYFISPCSDFSGGACQDTIPTLKRLELAAGPSFEVVTLVEGIEDLQLYFGVDALPAGAPDGAPDRNAAGDIYIPYPGDPATAAGREAWANVMGVQLYLLARAMEQTPGHEDKKTYVLSPAELSTKHEVAGADTPYKRHVFSSAVRVINPSGRREG